MVSSPDTRVVRVVAAFSAFVMRVVSDEMLVPCVVMVPSSVVRREDRLEIDVVCDVMFPSHDVTRVVSAVAAFSAFVMRVVNVVMDDP